MSALMPGIRSFRRCSRPGRLRTRRAHQLKSAPEGCAAWRDRRVSRLVSARRHRACPRCRPCRGGRSRPSSSATCRRQAIEKAHQRARPGGSLMASPEPCSAWKRPHQPGQSGNDSRQSQPRSCPGCGGRGCGICDLEKWPAGAACDAGGLPRKRPQAFIRQVDDDLACGVLLDSLVCSGDFL